jgi:hypothetical protein
MQQHIFSQQGNSSCSCAYYVLIDSDLLMSLQQLSFGSRDNANCQNVLLPDEPSQQQCA